MKKTLIKICREQPELLAKKISTRIITAVFQNPFGHIMPRENKIKLVNLAAQYKIPIIEDEFYNNISTATHKSVQIL